MLSNSKRPSATMEGDWPCPDPACGNINFARRSQCNKCGTEKEKGAKLKKQGIEIGKAMAEKSKGLFSADDWQCKNCGNVNWARRATCNMCNAPKIGVVEERTGYGGGFMERDENPEYRRRDDSDDEFDEFGRRKRRKGDAAASAGAAEASDDDAATRRDRDQPKKEDDDEEDDDDDGDVNKYKLDSDDDDDDDDGDLSKYALESDDNDDDAAAKPAAKDKKDDDAKPKESSPRGRGDRRSRSPRGRSDRRSRSPHGKGDRRSRSPHGRRDRKDS